MIYSGTKAKRRPALCRIWLRTEQSLPCHTTSSSFTSSSKFPNNLLRDFCVWGTQNCVCVCVCVRKKSEEDRRTVQLWRFTYLKKSPQAKLNHLNQAINDGKKQNWFWCLFSTFSVLNHHIRRKNIKYLMTAVLSKLWLCQRLNESVFILKKSSILLGYLFRYRPGKHIPGVLFIFFLFCFFLIQKAQSPLLKQINHLYLCILGLLGLRLKTVIECLYAEKTLGSNNIL